MNKSGCNWFGNKDAGARNCQIISFETHLGTADFVSIYNIKLPVRDRWPETIDGNHIIIITRFEFEERENPRNSLIG